MTTSAPHNTPQTPAQSTPREQKKQETRRANEAQQKAAGLIRNLTQRVSHLAAEQILMIPAILHNETLNNAELSLLEGRPQLQDASDNKQETTNPVYLSLKLNPQNHLRNSKPELEKAVVQQITQLEKGLPVLLSLWEEGIFTKLNRGKVDRYESLTSIIPWLEKEIRNLDLTDQGDQALAKKIQELTIHHGAVSAKIRNHLSQKMFEFIGEQFPTSTD